MSSIKDAETGVSEVVGEMLMIGLVIVLLSVFSAAIFTFLPTDRDPSINIMMSNDTQNNTITLWHKGGDFVKFDDLTVTIGNDTTRVPFSHRNRNLFLVPDKTVFDLGSNLTVKIPPTLKGDETVKLVTSRSVIYTGKVSL